MYDPTGTRDRVSATREFDHVILTRFSVRFEGFPPIEDDWLAYRWAFFRDALAASVARQTVRDFQWLVFFDIDTPAWLRAEIEVVGEGLFTPRYVATWSSRVAQAAVAEVSDTPFLITTRIDSDDAIAIQFVADVQSRFDHQESMYVNLLCGVQVERTGEVYRYDEPCGPFISYIERRVASIPPRTVFQSLSHGQSQLFADVLNVVGPPRWMQIIHGSNLANGVRGLRARPEPFEADFDIDLPFNRSVSDARYRHERLRSILDLARFWALHPAYAREYRVARRLRRAGTQVLTRLDAPVAPVEYPIWIRRVGSPIRQAMRGAETRWRRRRNRLPDSPDLT